MNIGQAAKASGISAKMIRYYERVGLIPKATRTHSGYRVYTEKDVYTLSFIQKARDLGFSVEKMHELLSLWRDRGRTSADVKALAVDHIEALKEKIEALQAMHETLRHLADNCQGDERPDCPIIDNLSDGVRADESRSKSC
ncbi:MerR family transcriptional regulator [Salinisphaera dokdonensis CL-ES53]|uniref:MerR family transcriptional regulator n=1 Tax=Salinisphaera dokdonensis CL-ES53 TaxID=1304272 RepID=A0ABV2B5J2_9GAMM